MNALMDNREQMLNPTAFIQSTFNTVGAQLALLLKIHAYNVTYVHRGLSFESALIDGIISIAEGKHAPADRAFPLRPAGRRRTDGAAA